LDDINRTPNQKTNETKITVMKLPRWLKWIKFGVSVRLWKTKTEQMKELTIKKPDNGKS
jgi:hypothetical protein